jgi:hypothetical protein
LHNDSSAKEKSLNAWRLATRNFVPKEEKFEIEGVKFRIIRFDHELDSLGSLSEVIIDAAYAAVGVVWIDSGLDVAVPCTIYECTKLFSSPPYREHGGVRSVGPFSLANAVEQALIDAKFSGIDSAVLFESRYNPDYIGWMLENDYSLQVITESGWLPK